MTDEVTERLVWETLARCVPDDEQRKAIVAWVHAKELLEDPKVVAARLLLSSASPEEVDFVFRLALKRGAFTAAEGASGWVRLRFAGDALAKSREPTPGELLGVSTTLLQSGELPGALPALAGDTRSFVFSPPAELCDSNRPPGSGVATFAGGVLRIFINRTSAGDRHHFAVTAVGDGEATTPIGLQVDLDDPTRLTAAIDWPHTITATCLLFAAVDEPLI